MTRLAPDPLRFMLTLLIVAAAALALFTVWRHYEDDPWTRDGRLKADTVQVSTDVAGVVSRVYVHENQLVRKGDPLFDVDSQRYSAKLAQADATLADARATLANAIRERQRYRSLGDLISREVRDQKATAVAQAAADVGEQSAMRRVAAIDLDRSRVVAGVNGFVTGSTLRPGNYISPGTAAFALVDIDSYYVVGYFEETKLHRFRLGDRARITFLGDDRPLWGHVDSLAAGIADRELTQSPDALPNANPSFAWIRLAQRVPVRVVIERVPAGMRLVAGRTATVTIVPGSARAPVARPASAVVTNTAPSRRTSR